MARVLTAGHVNWDVTLALDRLPRPDGEARIRAQYQAGGGSAANVAVALTGLDVSTGVLGSVGDDENGLLVRRELDAAAVDIDGLVTVPDAATSVKYLLTAEDGEVAVLGNDGVNEAIGPDDVNPDRVRRADHLHLTSQRPETAARLAEIAAEAGVTVSFDPGRRAPDRDFSRTFEIADLVFCNDREAAAVGGIEDSLGDHCTLVVKRGGDGAAAVSAEATRRHPGFGVDPVDTSGAGDAFAAGFLAAWLDDADAKRALAVGNACGALAAERTGARTSPSWGEIETLLAGRRDADG
ncbi:ribokinase [Natronoarchaeum philippinense]|uniref:Ribokinase n=1 Tax=Natronoarchaeum philippinense TaxID=558529 RepID=A0A285NBZ1_NATPI|nr:PfkB family carbohydrate kinase [Natronoarchaeum philippinense]SNZ07012.1 ribokinase [Natronoarchaeum philippinense]